MLRILLVEDALSDAELETRTLKQAGLAVDARRVDKEADFRRALDEFHPDAILCDYSIPGFDGMRALAIARTSRPQTPFIFVSGSIGEEHAIEAMKGGATDYVMKHNLARLPIAVERAVREAAERARAEMTLHRFRLALDNSADMILITDRSTMRHVDVNQTVCRLLGYTREELLRMGPPDILPVAREELEGKYDELIANPSQPSGMRSYYRCKDGSELPFESTRHVLRSGDRWFVAAISRDIRERIAAEQALRTSEAHLRRLNRVYAVLSSINGLIVRVRGRDELFREACRIAVEAGEFSFAWVGVVDRDAMQLRPVAWSGAEQGFLDAIRTRLSLRDSDSQGHAMVARAAIAREAIISNDVANDPRILFKQEHMEHGTRSLAALPLIVSGEVAGILTLSAAELGFFDDEEMKLLNELAGDISLALEHIEKSDKLDYLAYYDPLTGLANRTLFQERLAQYVGTGAREQYRLALIIINIERFKTINDTFGRQAGDALLKLVAARLLELAKDPNHLARVGADHFAMVIPHVIADEDLVQRLEQAKRRVDEEPYTVERTELRISTRAGVALFPADGADADSLFRNAESALKKSTSGERYLFYTQQMTERVAEKLALENKLRLALEHGEFVLHYQPKVDLATRAIVGVEALIRWQSPQLGLVPPGKFISLLEETGLILPVGSWALRQASLDHRGWVEQGLKPPRVAVNVSSIQLRQRDFVAIVEQAILDGVAPTGIDLEITESLIMQDVEATIEKLKDARGLGVRVAIDDFGTGYSSLAYLARLPVDTLKIDRAFIITMLDDPDTATLVQTMITLAHSLKLKVVAEGVEKEDQARVLRLLRCDQMQGYLFSKPLPLEAMTALLRDGSPQAG